jgi:hypothetical protein
MSQPQTQQQQAASAMDAAAKALGFTNYHAWQLSQTDCWSGGIPTCGVPEFAARFTALANAHGINATTHDFTDLVDLTSITTTKVSRKWVWVAAALGVGYLVTRKGL